MVLIPTLLLKTLTVVASTVLLAAGSAISGEVLFSGPRRPAPRPLQKLEIGCSPEGSEGLCFAEVLSSSPALSAHWSTFLPLGPHQLCILAFTWQCSVFLIQNQATPKPSSGVLGNTPDQRGFWEIIAKSHFLQRAVQRRVGRLSTILCSAAGTLPLCPSR